MKTRFIITLSAIAAAVFSLSSCNEKTGPDYTILYPNALVTVKNSSEGAFYLQLDDKTTLFPVNVQKSPFGDKQVRALCNFDFVEGKSEHFDRNVKLHWIDSVRTKDMVYTTGSKEEDELVYGTAPLEIYNSWITVLEDGYLTLSFCGVWGNINIPHSIDLVAGTDPEDPYLLELRHNDDKDNVYVGGTKVNGVIAFKLGYLPDTNGETVKLKIRFRSIFGEERTVAFDYCTGESSSVKAQLDLNSLTRGLAIE